MTQELTNCYTTLKLQTIRLQNPLLDVCPVYLDISKILYRVWHDGLIYKLKLCGISRRLLSVIQNFLKDRKQLTVLNGQCSTWRDILAGEPLGSILEHLLFLVSMDNLSVDDDTANHTSLFSVSYAPFTASADMNHDLALVSLWARDWRMSFYHDPKEQAVELLLSKKRHEVYHFVIRYLRGTEMNVLYLGIILDSKISFSTCIKSAFSSTGKWIGLLQYPSKYLPRHTLNSLYKLYVRPHLDYGDVIDHTSA